VLAAFTEVRTWDGTAEHINRVAWARHPDGRLLLTTAAIDGIARIWDAGTGRELHTLTGHTDIIAKAEWGHAGDGRLLLATGSYDGTARIWDPDTGECLHTLVGHLGASLTYDCVAVTWGAELDGYPVLATGDSTATVRIWDPGSGRELHAFPAGPNPGATSQLLYNMTWAVRADGQARLATCSLRWGTLRVWDPSTGRALYTSPADPTRDTTDSLAYGLRADGQLILASADDHEARIWTEEDGELTS